MRFVKNPLGTTHSEAILEPIAEAGKIFLRKLWLPASQVGYFVGIR